MLLYIRHTPLHLERANVILYNKCAKNVSNDINIELTARIQFIITMARKDTWFLDSTCSVHAAHCQAYAYLFGFWKSVIDRLIGRK